MEYRHLGRSGLRVSKLCLGTMRGFTADNIDAASRIMNEAVDGGVNFVDTADCYGESEKTVGKILERENLREKVVLATKFGWYMGKGANDFGASRGHIIEACEASLRKLRTDHIDLYILHVVDPNVPLDEVLSALDTLVKQGKVRYVGTSKHPVALLVESLWVSQRENLVRFVSEQPIYNLLDRRAENDLIWTALRHGLAITPFSPLGGGILSGKYVRGEGAPEDSGLHGRTPGEDSRFTEAAVDAVEKLRPLAEERDLTVAEFSLAWLMHQPGVTAPILGARKVEYLRSGLKASEVELTQEELERVDEIVPPGQYVSDYYDVEIHSPLRQRYREGARNTGAFVPDYRRRPMTDE